MNSEDWFARMDTSDDMTSAALHQRTEELYAIPDGLPDEDGMLECPVVVLRDIVVFPHMISPIFITPGSNLLAIQDAQFNYQTVIALVQQDPDKEMPTPEELLSIGVEMAVGKLLSLPDGNNSALVQGRRRVEVIEFTQLKPFYRARVRLIDEDVPVDQNLDALM